MASIPVVDDWGGERVCAYACWSPARLDRFTRAGMCARMQLSCGALQIAEGGSMVGHANQTRSCHRVVHCRLLLV